MKREYATEKKAREGTMVCALNKIDTMFLEDTFCAAIYQHGCLVPGARLFSIPHPVAIVTMAVYKLVVLLRKKRMPITGDTSIAVVVLG